MSRARARVAAVVVLAVALPFAALAVARHERGSAHGDVTSEIGARVELGRHVKAVLEPGARVRYDVDARLLLADRVTVDQPSGLVHYRVDDHARLTVHIPARAVTVRGPALDLVVDAAR